MLIDRFAPTFDAAEVHRREVPQAPAVAWDALWRADLGGSRIVRGLMLLRGLPRLVLGGFRWPRRRAFTLESVIEAGFGRLAEDPGREIVLGIAGRFWRPAGNVDPFDAEVFAAPVQPGRARALWNFRVVPRESGGSVLHTETRIVCGDPASRRKFRAYWLVVRPFSGLIRRMMLRAVAAECRKGGG